MIVAVSFSAFLLLHGGGAAGNTPAGTQTTAKTTKAATKTSAKSSKKKLDTSLDQGTLALDAALVGHPVVVASLFSPSVAVDVESAIEAKAGAAEAGVGYVAFNVFNEKQARELADLIGSDSNLANPAVLFFVRGRKLVFHLDGFADNQVVAQAARMVLRRQAAAAK
jgi:hypothetical protein